MTSNGSDLKVVRLHSSSTSHRKWSLRTNLYFNQNVIPRSRQALQTLWVISDRAEGEEKQAHQEEQQAGVDGSSMVGGQFALLIGLQAGSVSHDMGNVVLLLDPVEKVWHGAFGKDSYILSAMGLWIKRDRSLLTVDVIHWGRIGQKRIILAISKLSGT